MSQQKLTEKLGKFQIKSRIDENRTIIDMGFSYELNVVFQEDGKIWIYDKLRGFNPVSGRADMSLKSAMLSKSIGFIVVFLCCFILPEFFDGLSQFPYFLKITFVAWFLWDLFWMPYFHSKLESYRKLVIGWLDEDEVYAAGRM